MAVAEAVLAKPGTARDGVQESHRASGIALATFLSKVRHTDRDPVIIAPSTWQRSIMGLPYNSRNGHGSSTALEDMRATYLSFSLSGKGFVTRQLEDVEGRVWLLRPERLFDHRGYPASPVHLLAWLREQDNWLEV